MHEMFLDGIDLTFSQEYRSADSLAEELSKRFPGHPISSLLKLGVLQAQRMDFELEIDESLWDLLIETSIAGSKKLTDSSKEDLWGRYFLGAALGYDSYMRSETGDWLGTISKGLTSTAEFELVVHQDSTMYDAYLGIGTYKYWKSRKTEFLQWLPFVADERETGIVMLKKTVTRAEYSELPAIVSLGWILFDAKRFDESAEWSKRGLQRYPRNRQLLWICASSQMEAEQFSEAEMTCNRLIEEYALLNLPHPFFEIVWRNNLRVSLEKQQKHSDANLQITKLTSLRLNRLPQRFSERAADIFSMIDRAKKSSQYQPDLQRAH
jgi:tetratricopeptide (TPR) repeat protein